MRPIYLTAAAIAAAATAAQPAVSAAPQQVSGAPVNVSHTTDYAEGEVPMAVEPNNPLHVAAASNTWAPTLPPPAGQTPSVNGLMMSAVYTSLDGGKTWRTSRPDTGGIGRVANPLAAIPGSPADFKDLGNADTTDADVVFDRHGNLFFASGAAHNLSHNFREVETVYRSTDGGVSWQPPSTAVDSLQERDELDRPWLTVDNSGGPRDGTLYTTVETGAFTDDPPRVLVKRSVDHGLTWAPSVRVDDGVYATQFNPRARPTVDGAGALYVAYDRSPIVNTPFNPQVAPIELVVARSTDGGQTFTRTVADADVTRVTSPDEALGSSYSEMISAVAADPGTPGRVAVAWPEAIDASNSRIMARLSTDGGAHWSPRVDVADDAPGYPNQHDHVAIRWGPDGRLGIGWRDRRASGGSWTSNFQEFARVFAVDSHGTLSPSGPAVELTDRPQLPESGYKGPTMPDEFQGLAVSQTGLMMTWVQPVGATTDLMFRSVPLSALGAAETSPSGPPDTPARDHGLPDTGTPFPAALLWLIGLATAAGAIGRTRRWTTK